MRIELNVRNGIALAALSFLMQETHELAHTSVGRLICGCWGHRDFNVWTLCAECAHQAPLTLLATFAGPLYSFSIIWIGYYLLTRATATTKSVGFALIVSSMPFSRVLTPLFGGGDEIFALRRLGVDHSIAWALVLVVVLALLVPPVVKIYNLIENRRKLLWMIGLLLVPFLMVGAVVFAVLQGMILRKGILDEPWIMGSPLLVTLWLFVVVALLGVFGRHIPTLLQASGDDGRGASGSNESRADAHLSNFAREASRLAERHRVGQLAQRHLAGEISLDEFMSEIPDDAFDKEAWELIDLIEHVPKQGGLFGATPVEYKQYMSQIHDLTNRLLERTG